MICPHCAHRIGGDAVEGGKRLRLGIVLVDLDSGRVHGPCPHCKADVTVADTSAPSPLLFGAPHARRVVAGVPIPR